MPGVMLGDVAEHVRGNPSLRGSIETIFDSIVAKLKAVNGQEQHREAVQDIEAHKTTLLDAAFSNVGYSGRRLGPGETPTMAGDQIHGLTPREHADAAEALGNPALPRDASGHKVHPADAYSGWGGPVPGDRTATSFGGSGAGVDAQNRTDAEFAARNQPSSQFAPNSKQAQYEAAARHGIDAQNARERAEAQNGPIV